MTESQIKIVGTATCPYGELQGWDADGCRANLLEDGRVFNVLNGRFMKPLTGEARGQLFAQPHPVRCVAADLLSTTSRDSKPFRFTGVTEGSGEGAVAQGFGPEDIGTTVGFAYGEYSDVKVEISFSGRDAKAAEDSDATIGQDYDRQSLRITIGSVDAAAKALVSAGFRLVHADTDSVMKRLAFVKGREIEGSGMTSRIGVRASITWIAD